MASVFIPNRRFIPIKSQIKVPSISTCSEVHVWLVSVLDLCLSRAETNGANDFSAVFGYNNRSIGLQMKFILTENRDIDLLENNE